MISALVVPEKDSNTVMEPILSLGTLKIEAGTCVQTGLCPLLARSRHSRLHCTCPLLGVKRASQIRALTPGPECRRFFRCYFWSASTEIEHDPIDFRDSHWSYTAGLWSIASSGLRGPMVRSDRDRHR